MTTPLRGLVAAACFLCPAGCVGPPECIGDCVALDESTTTGMTMLPPVTTDPGTTMFDETSTGLETSSTTSTVGTDTDTDTDTTGTDTTGTDTDTDTTGTDTDTDTDTTGTGSSTTGGM